MSELTSILGLAQSGVSRHLGMLKEAGLIAEQREGVYTWYRLARRRSSRRTTASGRSGRCCRPISSRPPARPTAGPTRPSSKKSGGCGKRTSTSTAVRTPASGSWCRAAAGRRGRGRSATCCRRWRVADLGCGDGYLTVEASRWASRVIAVDRSRPVLERARGLARRRGVRNITWRQGEIERLPLGDATVDLAILSQALHHAAEPAVAVAEAARIVVPGGRVLVLDLREHAQEWVAEAPRRSMAGILRRVAHEIAEAGRARRRESVGRRAPGRRSLYRPHCQRHQARRRPAAIVPMTSR